MGSEYFERLLARFAVLSGSKPVGELESKLTDLMAAVACAAGALFLVGLGQAIVVLAVVPSSAIALRRIKAKQQARRIGESLPGQLRALADGLRVGRTLEQAAADCGRSGTAAGDLLGQFAAARLSGAELAVALRLFAAGANPEALAPVAVAISLNRRCGGDLPAALCGVAESLQSLADARTDADAATAQARFTARLVLGLPLVALAGICLVSPALVANVVATPVSAAMVAVAVVLQVVCMVTIRRIAAHACG